MITQEPGTIRKRLGRIQRKLIKKQDDSNVFWRIMDMLV